MVSSGQGTVEHIVLVKVKPDTEPTKVSAMVNAMNSLSALDGVLHLTVGPLLPNGPTSGLRFTHMLHSRYSSKDDLAAYNAHPDHIGAVRGFLFPVCDDLMVIDWVAGDSALPPPPPGSALRAMFLKLKAGYEVKDEVFDVVRGIKDGAGGIGQFSCGENFSPERAKGFSIASLAVFPGREEMESVDPNEGFVEVVDHLEDVLLM
ncbi:Stress-response A/B barrel domain-containing protein UP3, partial [Mucuna pruriens]